MGEAPYIWGIRMKRPSKKEIREAVEKLKSHKEEHMETSIHVPKPSGKKGEVGKIGRRKV